MGSLGYVENEQGDRYKYVLCYLHYGRDAEAYSNDLAQLEGVAKDMIADNTGKPLIIVNGNDEVVREYTHKRR